MTTMEGSSFEEDPILEEEEEEESWQPERAGRGVLYSIGEEGGSVRARDEKVVASRKRRQEGNGRRAALGPRWRCMR